MQGRLADLYKWTSLTQHAADREVLNDQECGLNGKIVFLKANSFWSKTVITVFTLLSVTIGYIIFRRPQPGTISPVLQGSWFVPNPGHYDHQGHYVADTWDHFQLPSCNCNPPIQQRQVPKWLVCAKSWQELFTKADCSSVYCVEDAVVTVTGAPTAPPRPPKCMTAYVANFNAYAGLSGCCYSLKTAEQFHRDLIKKHWGIVAQRSTRIGLLTWQGTHRCGPQEYGIDFQGIDIGRNWIGGGTSADCQKTCTFTFGCQGFSWCAWCGCWLKKLKINTTSFDRVEKPGIYSGFPCEKQWKPYQWLPDERAKHSLPAPQGPKQAATSSMLCVQVITPYSYEVDLVTKQYEKRMGIFGCALFAVYSNQVLVLPGGLTTRKINTSQVAEVAGQWNTALNTDVFMALWRAVILDGDYLKVNWIVKVDPDTVWFPNRLLLLLKNHGYLDSLDRDVDGISLLNCKGAFTTMHGPLEVFSQAALISFAKQSRACFEGMTAWGDWQWGEDLWVDQCMQKFTKIKRVYESQLMVEDHCHNWPGWRACTAERVAFHPFKNLHDLLACHDAALNVSNAKLSFTASRTTSTTTASMMRL